MRQELWIPGPLPGLNEMLADARKRRGKGSVYSQTKETLTNAVALMAKAARLRPVPAARFEFTWRERSRQRNPDNVAAAHKFILDGLVTAKVLPNDGWGEVLGWTDRFEVSPTPGVLVVIDDQDKNLG